MKILDFTHVQSGPTCTQLLAYMGADVIKVERPGIGDITRGQLRDVKGQDSLYFTMLNGSKRSITIDCKHAKGKEILDRLVKECDVLVENFAPGALDRMGLTFEHIHKLNPRMIVASVKGFGPGPYEDCKVYENVAQCAGGSASTTGFRDGPPLVTGAQIGDSRHRPASRARHCQRALPAHPHRPRPESAVRHAGRRAQSRAREIARPAAPQARPAHRIQPVRRGRAVRQGDAARRQRFRRRPAGLDRQMQGLGERSRRLHLFHHPGAGVDRDLRSDRQAGMEDRSGLRHAAGAAAAAAAYLRHDRGMDHDQDQVRGHGYLQQARHSGRADPVDEGDRRGAVAARDRHRGRGRSSGPRQISDGRQSDQAVGLARRRAALAASRRTHRRNLAQGARLFRQGSRRDQASGAITPPEKPAKAEAA